MRHFRILHAEDEDGIIYTVRTIIKEESLNEKLRENAPACGCEVEMVSAKTMAETQQALDLGGKFDAILLDLTFPDSSTELTLEWLNIHSAHLPPVIVITGSDRNEDMEKSFRSGALRFLLKDEMHTKPRHMLKDIYECILTREDINKRYGTKA